MSELTPKQNMFVLEYLKDLNATQAAIRAGYSEKTATAIGHENLTKPDISEAIQLAMEERIAGAKIDAAWVLTQAVAVHERCVQARQVLTRSGEVVMVETPDGELAPAFTFDSAGANKSLEIVGKHVDVQAFPIKIEHTGKGGNPIEIDSVGDMEVARRMAFLLMGGGEHAPH